MRIVERGARVLQASALDGELAAKGFVGTGDQHFAHGAAHLVGFLGHAQFAAHRALEAEARELDVLAEQDAHVGGQPECATAHCLLAVDDDDIR